eukprot:TRINITY_DN6812_c0_g1_i1.p1 TRINITY_DN6812_c0_g1~~TRINITY_DN6812_c0_g1_i1.p1  ORF type:complete len:449 (+),score=67.77 TRINITY_DN6812_c0_g1_i1:59-1405(+)
MTVSADESVLIHECAGLYASFALESLANFLLGLTFLYLILLISSKNELETPGRAVLRFIWSHLADFVTDTWNVAKTWPSMPHLPLEQRFAFCRKLNLSICAFSAMMAFIALTRWLHIQNVNGFRYLGYALTCPIMQAELVVLLAPVMPCYRLNMILVLSVTFVTMISGYVGSLFPILPWTGSLLTFVSTFNLEDLAPTLKFWVVLPSFVCMSSLVLLQIPFLAFVFLCRGGMRENRNLPYNYLRLLALVAFTWSGFPVWWLLSSEGFGIIHDTKANGFGFCFLNILSKGCFTMTMLSMVKSHKRRWLPDLPVETPRNAAVNDLWIVKVLRPYDIAAQCVDVESGRKVPGVRKEVSFGLAQESTGEASGFADSESSEAEAALPAILGREKTCETSKETQTDLAVEQLQTAIEAALEADEELPMAAVAVAVQDVVEVEERPDKMCHFMCY